jgi:hypothetical protein
MSAKSKAGIVWTLPVVLIVSWLAVRGLAASPPPTARALSASPSSLVVADRDVADPSLRRLIARFADAARARSAQR